MEFRGTPDATVITRDGGIARRRLARMRAQVADVDNHSLENLARQPDVARVLPDRPAFATIERSGASIGAAFARWQFGLTGQGVGVAVIDSGVAALHDDLNLANPLNPQASPRVLHFRDFTTEDSEQVWLSELPTDDFGHGTHVAGIIAGNGFDWYGVRTAAWRPRAHLVALKVLDANGQGYVSDVIEAIDYAIAIKDTYNIRVINLSVATGVFESYRTDPLAQAAKRAVDAGIVVVAAAGNLGENETGARQFGGITCPGNAPWVLTVGAASHEGTTRRSDDTRGAFSSIGPTWIDFAAKPDLLAYGVGIESLAAPHSTLYTQHPDYLLDGMRPTPFKPYMSLTGTSMAAPVVTGTIALMLEANPKLTPNAIKALLQYSAEPRAGEHALAQGAGLLNARGAIRMARFFEAPARRGPMPWDILAGEGVLWSTPDSVGQRARGRRHPAAGQQRLEARRHLGRRQDAGRRANHVGREHRRQHRLEHLRRQHRLEHQRRRQHRLEHARRQPGVEHDRRGQHRLEHRPHGERRVGPGLRRRQLPAHALGQARRGRPPGAPPTPTTTSSGAPTTTTSSGAPTSDDNIVWSTGENIVWSTNDDNIVWSTTSDDNIVWSTGRRTTTSCGARATTSRRARATTQRPTPATSSPQPELRRGRRRRAARRAAAEDAASEPAPVVEPPTAPGRERQHRVEHRRSGEPGATTPATTTARRTTSCGAPAPRPREAWRRPPAQTTTSCGARVPPATPAEPAAESGASEPPVAIEGAP